ncbi:GTP-binding protein [soil metagenome]
MVSVNAASPLPLDLVTGFLGSGKTTLINAVLQDPAFAGTMVIVNEFGEVGLDHMLISSAEDQVVLLDSGCLCCAVSGSLRDTLIDLFSRRGSGSIAAFDRIIVETSGLANPAPLVASLLGDSALTPRCTLSQVLTLVDAMQGLDTLARYQEAQRQVAFADRLLITKTDSATPARIDELQRTLAALNPNVPIERSRPGDTPAAHFTNRTAATASATSTTASPTSTLAWLRGPMRPQYADESASPHGEAFGQIVTHVLRVPQAVDWAVYAAWTDHARRRCGKRLLRCKGLLSIDGDSTRWVIQGVQGYFAKPVPLATDELADAGGFLVCIGDALDRSELTETLTLLGVDLTTPKEPSR